MRSAKEAGCFPYGSKLVCYIEVFPNGEVRQISTKAEKKEALQNVLSDKSKLFAVWPGQWRSDLFLIDDLEAFADRNNL